MGMKMTDDATGASDTRDWGQDASARRRQEQPGTAEAHSLFYRIPALPVPGHTTWRAQ